MKKIMLAALAALMLLPLGARADEDQHVLTIGDYDSATDRTGVYDGSYNEMAPTTFYSSHTGSQMIYTRDDLASLAGKNITALNFVFYHMGSYDEITRDIKVYLQQVDAEEFAKDEKNKYQFFDFSTDSLCLDSTFYEYFGIEDDYMNHELTLHLNKPYYYDGTKSLLVTITFDGDVTTAGSDYAAFYAAGSDYKKRVLTFCDDNNTFADFIDSDDWPTATSSTGTGIELPLTQFTYETPETPKPVEVRALTIDAVTLPDGTENILCNRDGSASLKTQVKLTNSGNVDLNPGDEGYTLTLTNEAGDTIYATATIDSVLTAGESKQLDVTFSLAKASDYAGGCSLWMLEGITNTKAWIANIVFEKQHAAYKVVDAQGQDVADGTTTDFGTLTNENVSKTFQLINQGNIAFLIKSVSLPEGFTTTLTSKSLAPADTLQFSVTANNYLVGQHSGNLTISFYNDSLADFNLALASNVVEADTVLTLGNYNGRLAEGTQDDCFQGSYFDRAPTTYYLLHTGSQIIYTRDQLARMAEKGIKEMRFVFFNLGVYANHPRTVNVWAQETDATAFERDEQASNYKFFDFENATKVVANRQVDIDFIDYAGTSGELALPFDQTFNYSGEKNIVFTITFDGDDCVDSSFDLDFFCNDKVKKSAMTYTSDSYSFADFLETEDWPYATSGTGYNLEQPITRFFFGEPIVTGINTVKAPTTTANGATYNLAGQRVGADYKGIVIENGQKKLRK